MVWIVRKLFWLAMFLVATFCFVVLFEHGTHNFGESARTEFESLTKFFNSSIERGPDQSDKIGQ